ncbi:MAG: tetratricopeptide repeat protein [Proteobacteria bacterium]|nr:tetratricopeptide repeat protein [Pseudomonadota bacterium]MBU1687938.1 tetratricopeptide repeat protein [Pseudomonadota bacterium]
MTGQRNTSTNFGSRSDVSGQLTPYDLSGREYWESNLVCLGACDPRLAQMVREHQAAPVGRLLNSEAGFPSVALAMEDGREVLAYGLKDPWEDAAGHFENVPADARGLVVFVGMGLGYGPLLIARERPMVRMIMVFEPSLDLFCLALRALDLTPLIRSSRVAFFVGEDTNQLQRFEGAVGRLAALEDTSVLRQVPSYQWREDLYAPLDNRIFMSVNHINAHGGTTSKCGREFFRNRLENLTLLPHSHDIEALRDSFRGKPAVLVAAGPSLDRTLPEIRAVRDCCVLIAADSALAPLRKAGIMPDFVTSLDFQAVNFEKFTGSLGEKLPFSLVAMIKATPQVPKYLPAKHLFFAFPEDRPHKWLVDALGIPELKVDASSVVHLSLGLALVIGADPIFLTGQDLAFTDRVMDHAGGTVFTGVDVPAQEDMVYVDAIGGGKVATSRNHLVSKKIFEDVFAEYDRQFYNGTAAGADIVGAPPLRIEAAKSRFFADSVVVPAIVEKIVATVPKISITRLSGRVDQVRRDIREMERLISRANKLAAGVERKFARMKDLNVRSLEDLPTEVRQVLVDFDRTNKKIDGKNDLWQQVMELTFHSLGENDRLKITNDEILREEGYLAWLGGEIRRINKVNAIRGEGLSEYRRLLSSLQEHNRREKVLLVKATAGDRQAARQLAELYLRVGDLNLARQTFEELLADPEGDVEEALVGGEIFLCLLDFTRAEQFFCRVAATELGKADELQRIRLRAASFWIGIGKKHGEMYPHLLQIWLARIARMIDDPEALRGALAPLWKILSPSLVRDLTSGAVEEATIKLDPWRVVEEHLPAGYYRLKAELDLLKGQNIEAEEHLGRARAMEPGLAEDAARLAKLMIETGRYQEGIDFLREAVALDSSQAEMWEDVGDLLAAAGDPASAITAYEQCFTALPQQWSALKKMGDCLYQTGSLAAARTAYQQVVRMLPDETRMSEAMTQVRELVEAGEVEH